MGVPVHECVIMMGKKFITNIDKLMIIRQFTPSICFLLIHSTQASSIFHSTYY